MNTHAIKLLNDSLRTLRVRYVLSTSVTAETRSSRACWLVHRALIDLAYEPDFSFVGVIDYTRDGCRKTMVRVNRWEFVRTGQIKIYFHRPTATDKEKSLPELDWLIGKLEDKAGSLVKRSTSRRG